MPLHALRHKITITEPLYGHLEKASPRAPKTPTRGPPTATSRKPSRATLLGRTVSGPQPGRNCVTKDPGEARGRRRLKESPAAMSPLGSPVRLKDDRPFRQGGGYEVRAADLPQAGKPRGTRRGRGQVGVGRVLGVPRGPALSSPDRA